MKNHKSFLGANFGAKLNERVNFFANLNPNLNENLRVANLGAKFNEIAILGVNFKRIFATNSNLSECER